MKEIEFATVVEMLEYQAINKSENSAYIFLENGELELVRISYRRLLYESKNVAARLLSQSNIGDPVLLVLTPGIEFVIGFYACILAGMVAVPAFSPTSHEKNWKRLDELANDCDAKLVIINSQYKGLIKNSLSCESINCVSIEDLIYEDFIHKENIVWPKVKSEDIAFLQYTSGSTAAPKGVMVSHANLISNLSLMRDSYGHTEASNFVMWVPLYHDLGLIGHMLQTTFLGVSCYMMSPEAFIKKPIRWLKAISDYRATVSMAPNFAFDFCIKNISQQELEENEIDLSTWAVAAIGAEPIREKTVQAFYKYFQPFGFRESAIYGTYGLAEATLIVVADRHDSSRPTIIFVDKEKLQSGKVSILREDRGTGYLSQGLVSSGRVGSYHEMKVINPETTEICKKWEIGELCFRGPSIAKGYLNKPEITDAVFRANIEGKEYLRSGDLGFVHDGNVFVVGRIKELIIINGVNYYPQDIEFLAYDSHLQIRRGCGAAFSIDEDDIEKLILVLEIRKEAIYGFDGDEICSAIRDAVIKSIGVYVNHIYLIMPSKLSKTTSGKIRRNTVKAQYLANDIKYLHKSNFI